MDNIPDDEINLELDPDEARHLQSLPEKYIVRLRLTNEGAVLSQKLSGEACKDFYVTDSKMILTMLVLKIAEQTRITIKGILLGYYSAVPVLLRSVLDSISVLRLISSDERQLKIWILLSYIDKEKIEIEDKNIKKLRKEFASKARLAYDSLISDDPHLKPVTDLVNEFNAHVHPDIFGVFERTGIQIDVKEILGDSIRQALLHAHGDPNDAIKLLDIEQKNQYGNRSSKSTSSEKVIFGSGLLEEELVDHYSQVAHAAIHHTFDMVDDLFGRYVSKSTKKDGNEWHERSMAEFEKNNPK